MFFSSVSFATTAAFSRFVELVLWLQAACAFGELCECVYVCLWRVERGRGAGGGRLFTKRKKQLIEEFPLYRTRVFVKLAHAQTFYNCQNGG